MSKKLISLPQVMLIIAICGGLPGITTIIVNSHIIKKTFWEKPPISPPINPEETTNKKLPTPDATTSKPSPEKMVQDYYFTINNRDYQTAWRRQSENFKLNTHEANKRRGEPAYNFTAFRNWWQKEVNWIKVESVKLVNSDNEKATVDVKLQYEKKTGKLIDDLLRLNLVWDLQSNNWLIDESSRPSQSDMEQKTSSSAALLPKISIQTERVSFTANDTEIQRDGSISPNQKKRYLISRKRGQRLAVKLLQGNVSFVVIDPAGQMSDRITKIGYKSEPPVRRDGDYAIEISSATNSDYVVSFELRSQDSKPSVTPSIVAPKLEVRSQPFASANAIVKPSPEQMVRDYYSTINNRDYETAWQQQSDKFKANKTPKRPDYNFQIFRNWWQKEVFWLKIKELKLVESNSDKAIVYVRLKYQKKSGRLVDHPLRLSLIWDAKNSKWLIDESETLPD
ncbi:MAG: hypothetical protein U7127_12415 [Phormidium sp.]